MCKPSEITSVTAWMLCKLIKDAGLPNGVLNMVFGTGSKAGEALINHQGVNVINQYFHVQYLYNKKMTITYILFRLYHLLDPRTWDVI